MLAACTLSLYNGSVSKALSGKFFLWYLFSLSFSPYVNLFPAFFYDL